ncbi:S8 family serine peptidase [Deinococcus aquiradiocola]|nr:S8 family serine peptidase [Deinococcus aquiradiocola]
MLPLLTCSLLAACGGPATPGGDPGAGGTTYTVSGAALLPGAATTAQALQPVTQAAGAGTVDWTLPHVQGEVLVVGAGRLPGTLGTLSVTALGDGSGELRLVRTPAGESDQAFAARLAQELTGGLAAQGSGTQALTVPTVTVQPNYIYSALAVPNDPGYPSASGAGVTVAGAAYDQDYLTRINAEGGWAQIGAAPTGAVTAVLDTGVDRTHPELASRLLPGYDFANNDSDPSEAAGGDVGHGTSSAGLIGAATNNATGIAGLTWTGRTVMPLRVFDDAGGATTANLARAVGYATQNGARVVNMSLGLKGANVDAALAQRLQAASQAGVVLVAAAGNTPSDGLYYPAADPNVIAVGALGKTDALACYSARPKSGDKALDLVAPGGNATLSGTSCVGDPAYGILTLAPTAQTTSPGGPVGGGYALRIGTSEAAPLVSGAASLILGARPDLNAAQVKSALVGSARSVAGGRLLDVGAAVKAALALPQNAGRAYTLAVTGGGTGKTFTGTLANGVVRVPFSLPGVAAGQTTLQATLTVDGRTATGSLPVTVNGDLNGQSIQTR